MGHICTLADIEAIECVPLAQRKTAPAERTDLSRPSGSGLLCWIRPLSAPAAAHGLADAATFRSGLAAALVESAARLESVHAVPHP